MQRFKDHDIGRLWREHYPNSQQKSGASKKPSAWQLRLFLEDKAQALAQVCS
jgi:hypothetical protein